MARITALYSRVSTENQAEEGYSLDIQHDRLEAYAKSQGFENFVHYVDPGYSGSNLNRPQMQRLLFDIKDGLIERVIIMKLDRLSRNQRDILYFVEDVVNALDISLISVSESLDTSTPVGRTFISFLGTFAQFERETIRERLASGLDARVAEGKWPGGRVPFGYDYDPTLGKLVPNDDAECVRNIFKWFLSGETQQQIALRAGFNPTDNSRVKEILSADYVTGRRKWNGDMVEIATEPLVSMDTYEKAQAIRARRYEARPNRRVGNMLTGLIYCGKCGARLFYQRRRDGKYNVCCYSRVGSKAKEYMVKDPNCTMRYFDAEEIEKGVSEQMLAFSGELTSRIALVKPQQGLKEALRMRQDAAKNKLRKLYTLFSSSEAGADEELLKVIATTKNELDLIESELSMQNEATDLDIIVREGVECAKSLKEGWPSMTKQQRRIAAHTMIRKITFNEEEIKVDFLF